MSDQIEAPPPEPVLRPEARVVRADRSLAAMVLLVCTLGGMGIGFGSAMYLMRMQWGAGAYPAEVMRVPAGCNETSKITWLGVAIRSYSGREGTLVLRVFDGTAAERAGLQPGDVVSAVDGSRILAAEDLVHAILSRTPGQLVNLGIERNGEPMTIQARLGRK